ncbi:MAG: leucyl/phenylalanyl-tRNA--protein transferase [Stagnimonas sp.]|nr:leucyl/phenylalanyl-tRNA--protein transferase [Stagnimonas sp.]
MTAAHPARLHWLDPRQPAQPFPDPAGALPDPNGLLAIGGDLSSIRLLNAYREGIFPWFNPDEPILWWSPDPRCVFVPSQVHISHSLAKRIRQCDYAVSFDRAFGQTLAACAGPRRGGRGTWLGPEMRAAYQSLHRSSVAHSIEVWRDGALIGGLYGIAIGRIFFGESMFSTATDASKLALVHLAQQLHDWGFALIDCQVASPHLLTLGATTMTRADFRAASQQAQQQPAPLRWQFDALHAGNAKHLPA